MVRKKNNFALRFTSTLSSEHTLKCNIAITKNSKIKNGPLVDDCAPYSAIGMVELKLVDNISNSPDMLIDPKPSELSQYDF